MSAIALRVRFAVGLVLLASTTMAGAQGTESVGRSETFEVAVENPRSYADPYRDVSLRARFESPAGRAIEIDGFFAGERTWKARFRPSENGRWRYALSFSDGAPAKSGTFEVRRAQRDHPPLEINPANPIWLRRGGRPFLVRALHVGDRFFAANWPQTQRTTFLDWVQRQGYNTLSIASHLLNRDEAGRGRGWATPRLWPLDATAYDTMEQILDELQRREIIVYPFAGFIGKNSSRPHPPQDQELYLRYTLARLGHYPNLIFNVAGPEPNLREDWLPVSDVERLGRLIRALDVYRHPLTVHNESGPDPYRDSDWTTMGTLQGPKTLDRQKLARGVQENHHPAKPLFAQETLWSRNRFHMRQNGRDYSDDDLRKHLLVLNLNAAGVCFADNDGDSSSGFSGSLDPADAWQARHDILKRTWDLFAIFPYWQMKPRPDLVDTGWALATPGRQYLIYLDCPGTVNVAVEPGPYHYEWIDARDPARPRVSGLTADGRGLSTPDGGDDWLLWLATLPHARPASSPPTRHDGGAVVPPDRLALLEERAGFGRDVTGGAGGTLYLVTHDGNDGPGSLREGASLGGRWIVFAEDFHIQLKQPLAIAADTTIDGAGRHVTISGGTLQFTGIDRRNLILHNLTLRDSPGGADIIRIGDGATGFWLHHLTLSNSTDEYIDISRAGPAGAHGTISRCRFDPGTTNRNEYAILIGDRGGDGTNHLIHVTLHHNWYNATRQRHPIISGAVVHSYNNYVQWRLWGIHVHSQGLRGASVVSEHDVFDASMAPPQNQDDAVKVEGEGHAVRVVEPLLLHGATVQISNPDAAFAPQDHYPYVPDSTEQVLATVRERAGAH